MAGIRQLHFIDALLEYANLTPKQIEAIKNQVDGGITEGEAENLTTYLLENQTDPIASGRTYTQTDIQKKLSQWKQY